MPASSDAGPDSAGGMGLEAVWRRCGVVHGKSYTTQLTLELRFVSNSKAGVQKHAT